MSSDPEKRRLKRHAVDIDVNVMDCLQDREPIGKLVNIHVEGMMVLARRTVHEGGIYQLSLEAEPDFNISVGAECLWTQQAAVKGHHWAGYRIIDISTEARADIGRLIKFISGE